MYDPTDDVYQENIKDYSRQPSWYRRGQHLRQIKHSVAITSEPNLKQIDAFFTAFRELQRNREVGK